MSLLKIFCCSCFLFMGAQFAFADGQLSALEKEQVQTTLKQAHQLMLQNNNDEAKRVLDQSIRTLHAAEIEVTLIRAMMQAGEYQQALAMAAHVQAEHPHDLDINLLYAWLLALGGHEKSAIGLLEERLSSGQFVEAEVGQLAKMKTMISKPRLIASDWDGQLDALNPPSEHPKKYNQYQPVSVPMRGQWLTAGLLAPDGQHVLVVQQHANAEESKQRSDVRYQIYVHQHGFISAQWQQKLAEKMDVFLLDRPVNVGSLPAQGVGLAKPGQPVYVVGTPYPSVQPAWPSLQTDVLGNVKNLSFASKNDLQVYRLHLKNPAKGAIVYNLAGQVLGLSMLDEGGNSWLLPIPSEGVDRLKATPPGAGKAGKLSADDIYELGFASQVLVYGSAD